MRHDRARGSVHVDGEPIARRYSAVLSTTALGALQRICLGDLGLAPIRMEASAFCTMATRSRWLSSSPIHGGRCESNDDAWQMDQNQLSLRVSIYSSVEPIDYIKIAVLLCSYIWSQEAVRLTHGTLLDGEGPRVDLVLWFSAIFQRAYLAHDSYDWGSWSFCSRRFCPVRPKPI